MKKLDSLMKCTIGNKVLQLLNNGDIEAGEVVTITIKTKKNGDIAGITLTKGEATK